jgi:hypothetical protein
MLSVMTLSYARFRHDIVFLQEHMPLKIPGDGTLSYLLLPS